MGTTTLYRIVNKTTIMPFTGIRLHPRTKAALEHLAGKDYTMDDVVNMLLEDFIETTDDDDDDDAQLSLFDYDDDDEE